MTNNGQFSKWEEQKPYLRQRVGTFLLIESEDIEYEDTDPFHCPLQKSGDELLQHHEVNDCFGVAPLCYLRTS